MAVASPGSPGYTSSAPSSNSAEPSQGQIASGDAGQSVVGELVKNCPWIPSNPSITITQGYGQTSYTGEPPGHGYPHWHAGVDLGVTTGTTVVFPGQDTSNPDWQQWIQQVFGSIAATWENVSATYHRGVWNGSDYGLDPDGYGSHPVTLTFTATSQLAGNADVSKGQGFDVILGHGYAWLQNEDDQVNPGDQLLMTDCEGNCSGPHLHFEVRPVKGLYGTDVDPWGVLMNGKGTTVSNPATNVGLDVQAAAQAIEQGITTAADDAVKLAIGLAEASLGGAVLGLGIWLMFKGVQQSSVGRAVGQAIPSTPRRAPARRSPTPDQQPPARVARAGIKGAGPAAPVRLRGGSQVTLTRQQAETLRERARFSEGAQTAMYRNSRRMSGGAGARAVETGRRAAGRAGQRVRYVVERVRPLRDASGSRVPF